MVSATNTLTAEDAPRPRPRTEFLVTALSALGLATIGSLASLWLAGPGLGVLFGACAAAALLAPTLACAPAARSALTAAAGVAVGCAAGPAVAALGGQLPLGVAAAGAGVAASLALAAGGVTALLASWRLVRDVTALVVTLAALLWLAWPVWLSPYLAGQEAWVARLSAAHPLMALDAAVTRAGGHPWAQHKLMYAKLTNLGQHVLPRPPPGVTAAVLCHAGVGVAGMAAAWAIGRRSQGPSDEPADPPRPVTKPVTSPEGATAS